MKTKMRIDIDLAKYGMDGTVELAPPSPRKERDHKNALSRCAGVTMKNGEPVLAGDILTGDYEILTGLLYVRKAPFPMTVEGLLDFTDRLDEIEYGYGEEFWREVIEGAEKIERGEISPFVPSPAQETQNSD